MRVLALLKRSRRCLLFGGEVERFVLLNPKGRGSGSSCGGGGGKVSSVSQIQSRVFRLTPTLHVSVSVGGSVGVRTGMPSKRFYRSDTGRIGLSAPHSLPQLGFVIARVSRSVSVAILAPSLRSFGIRRLGMPRLRKRLLNVAKLGRRNARLNAVGRVPRWVSVVPSEGGLGGIGEGVMSVHLLRLWLSVPRVDAGPPLRMSLGNRHRGFGVRMVRRVGR